MIVLAQLNEARVVNAKRPRPTLGDIRGSGMIKNDSDLTMFVFREQDSQGTILYDGAGEIYIAKGRNTAQDRVKVWYDPRSMTFGENPWL
jgi:replicative DNA helicase